MILRRLRKVPCECKYPKFCTYRIKAESQKTETLKPELLNSASKSVEKEYVYDVYDKIAEHFHHTRYNMWPQVRKFLETFDIGTILCDVGMALDFG